MKNCQVAEKFIKLIGKQKLWPPLHNYSTFVLGSEWTIKRFFGKYYSKKFKNHQLFLMDGKESLMLVCEDSVKMTSSEFFQRYLKNPKALETKLRYFYKSIAEIDKLYAKADYKFVEKNNLKMLLDLCEQIRFLIWDPNAATYFSIFFEKEFGWEEIKKSKFKITRKELDYVWDKAIHPVEGSFDKQQLLHILRLLAAGKNWTDIAEECQYVYSSYRDAKNLQEVEKRLKEQYGRFNDKKIALREIAKEEKEEKTRVEHYRKWHCGLSKNQQIIADFLQAVIIIRDLRKNFFNKGVTVWWRVAQRMFEEAGISEDYIIHYTFYEFKKGLAYLKKNKKLIENRTKGFINLVPYDGKIVLQNLSQSDFQKSKKLIMDFYLKSHATDNKEEIKGNIGSPGKIKGRVKVIMNAHNDPDFKEGDILVTGMTRPEFVPLMKKASAIITDEGGITCHAAIVSRELKKPCIIGTKIATKVLKDGDIVEVDADRGIIKIIK
jgi:phosphohistidine swiveling domain-containing protein